jgi:hypothetical protein
MYVWSSVRVPVYRSRDPGFGSRCYQILWEVVGLELGPLSPLRITEELLEWKSNGSGLGNQINGRSDPLRWPRDTLYQQKLAVASPTSGGRSVGIVRLRTKNHGVICNWWSVFFLLCVPTFGYFKWILPEILYEGTLLDHVLVTGRLVSIFRRLASRCLDLDCDGSPTHVYFVVVGIGNSCNCYRMCIYCIWRFGVQANHLDNYISTC